MNRYIDVDDSVVDVFLTVLEERFPSLIQLKIKLLFDTKRRIKQGELVLAATELASEKIKFFSKDNTAADGYDVVIFFDKKAWELSSEADRRRMMSHELRHILLDTDGSVKLVPHDISDFRVEQKLNADDPEWSFRLGILVNDIYEQEKEMSKQGTKKTGE